MLESYLIELSKLIVCGEDTSAESVRAAGLIEKKMHPDVGFYPKEKKLSVANADEIIAQSVVKPLELNMRLFVMNKFEELAQYQNKLLKTLEEPPKNVVLLMGSVNDSAVLSTVKSRSKILSVPLFSERQLIEALKGEYTDREKLSVAVALSGGRLGQAKRFYESDMTIRLYNTCVDLIDKMNKAQDVLRYAAILKNFDIKDVISALKVVCGKILGGEKQFEPLAVRYRPAVFIAVVERLGKLEKTVNFNGNATMVIDRLLFAVMEEKSRWQRLSV